MPTHAEKNRGRRVLFPLKRANIAAFCLCLYDRAAGHVRDRGTIPGSLTAAKQKAGYKANGTLLIAIFAQGFRASRRLIQAML
jgi:hypothetical protein